MADPNAANASNAAAFGVPHALDDDEIRLSRPEVDEVERQIKSLLEKGYIRRSSSPYGSPVTFVKCISPGQAQA